MGFAKVENRKQKRILISLHAFSRAFNAGYFVVLCAEIG